MKLHEMSKIMGGGGNLLKMDGARQRMAYAVSASRCLFS